MLVLILAFLIVVYCLVIALHHALVGKWRAEEKYYHLVGRHLDYLCGSDPFFSRCSGARVEEKEE